MLIKHLFATFVAIMSTIEIILSVLTGLGLTGNTLLGVLFHRATNKRIQMAEADKAEAQANEEEWELEHKRLEETHQTIMTLNEIIKTQGETISRQNKALDEKTMRLRDAQDEKDKYARENANLIRENGEMKLRLQKHECIKLACIDRDPPNEHTLSAIARQKQKDNNHKENNKK